MKAVRNAPAVDGALDVTDGLTRFHLVTLRGAIGVAVEAQTTTRNVPSDASPVRRHGSPADQVARDDVNSSRLVLVTIACRTAVPRMRSATNVFGGSIVASTSDARTMNDATVAMGSIGSNHPVFPTPTVAGQGLGVGPSGAVTRRWRHRRGQAPDR